MLRFLKLLTAEVMHIRLVTKYNDFLNLKDNWNSLLEKSNNPSPFLTFEWVSSWLETFGDRYKLYILVVHADKAERDLIGIAPLTITKEGIFNYLYFIGTGRSDHLGFIVKGNETSFYKAVFNFLRQNRRQYHIIYLKDILEHSTDFETELKQSPFQYKRVKGDVSPYLKLPESFEAYLGTKSKKSKKNIKRYLRKVVDEDCSDHVQIIGQWDDKWLDIIKDIEAKSWKGKEKSERMSGIGFEFYQKIMRKFAEAGWLNLLIYFVGDTPVAYHLNFIFAGKVYYYNGSYLTDVKKYTKLAVGTTILAVNIKESINNSLSEYDFLRGDHGYKRDWAKHTRHLYYYIISPPGIFASMAWYYVNLKLKARKYKLLQKIRKFFLTLIKNDA